MVTKSDAIFKVYEDEEMLGTLTVSRGAVVWFPRKASNGYKMGWTKFAKVMAEQASRIEKR